MPKPRVSTSAPRAWTTADIPDQTGRVAVVNGANTSLDLQTAALSAKGAHVVPAVRNLANDCDALLAVSA